MNANIRSVFLTYRAAARVMERQGRIIGIGSSGYNGSVNAAIYAMTKAAVVAMSNSLAAELAPRLITVNTLHPGPVATGIYTPLLLLPIIIHHYLSASIHRSIYIIY